MGRGEEALKEALLAAVAEVEVELREKGRKNDDGQGKKDES